ncbi:MAG: hypothetical protein RLY17_892 [Pseudomonadota bacterium]|jgi:hypothetical protein
MVAIKQVANSTPLDIRKDQPADVSRSAMWRSDKGRSMRLVQQTAQKKMVELLAKAKQRKKQAEEQLSPPQFSPMMIINNLPLSTRLVLPNIMQQPESVSVHKHGVSLFRHEAAEKPQTMKETRAKPVTDKASGLVATEVLTPSNVVLKDNSEPPLSSLFSVINDTPERPMASVPSSIGKGHKDDMSDTLTFQEMRGVPRLVIEEPAVVSSESVCESISSLPLAAKKESTQSDDRTPMLATQSFVTQSFSTQQLVTQAPAIIQPEEMKTTSQALMTALPEPVAPENEPTAGRRTLSYTFTQWKNSPVVTFELSNAGELTAMTNSVEVQQALRDNHHWLVSQSSLHFRDEQHDEERRGQQQSEQEDNK